VFLRRQLAARIDLRVFPRLRFHWDPTPERADQIERVLATLRDEDDGTASMDASRAQEDFVDPDEDGTIDND
jgi:ribosome-binding factor A